MGARTGKYKLAARIGKYKYGAKAGKYKFGDRARAGGQAKDRGPGNTNTPTRQNIIFRLHYQSYYDYLFKISLVNKEEAVFEQLVFSDFNKWSAHH